MNGKMVDVGGGGMSLEERIARIPAPVKHIVQVRRCNRWDVYPQQEPVETCEVMARPRRADENESRFAGRMTDALAEQHPRWRVASPIVVKIEVAR